MNKLTRGKRISHLCQKKSKTNKVAAIIVAFFVCDPSTIPCLLSQAHLELIYDTSFADVQPYLFKVSHSCSERPVGSMGMGLGGGLGGLAGQDGGGAGGGPGSPSVTTTVRRLLKDTLAI